MVSSYAVSQNITNRGDYWWLLRPRGQTMTADPIPVDAARLDWEKGDIHESYSADRISEEKPVRAPFEWSGSLWVCVGITGKGLTVTGEHELEAYRLVPPQIFKGEPTTYSAKVAIDSGDFARADPMGFYHGIQVKCGGKIFVMFGPPATFIAEPVRHDVAPKPAQMSLFA